jgi:hypothetical protein
MLWGIFGKGRERYPTGRLVICKSELNGRALGADKILGGLFDLEGEFESVKMSLQVMGLMEDLVDPKIPTAVEFSDERELLGRRKFAIGGDRAVGVLRDHKENAPSSPEGSSHFLPKGLEGVRWDCAKGRRQRK